MVKGGEGDWLQTSKPLVNPYWGSKMLHCGKEVHKLPVGLSTDERSNPQSNTSSALPGSAGRMSGMGATGDGVNNYITLK